MGHVTLAGYVTETEIGGGKLMKIDVPKSNGMQPFTSFFGSSSVYKMTPVDEETVLTLCQRQQQQPFQSWELKSAFNDWAREHREELKAKIREEVRRELEHKPPEAGTAGGDPAVDDECTCADGREDDCPLHGFE